MSLDSLSLELEAEMLRQVGQSIQRVKKRLVDTDLTFQLRPPETEEMELSKWEDKVRKLIDHRDVMAFPKLLDFKRQFKQKHSDDQEVRQVLGRKSRDVLDSKLRHQVRDKETTKVYKSSFGGAVVGESLRTIENYSGQNTFYGGVNSSSRVLIRKDGRFTNYDRASDLPPWICEGAYANNDPALFRERPCGVYTLPFQSQGRQVAQTGDKLRGELIARRENLDSWKSRDHGPHFARIPESQSVRWLQSQQEFFDSSDQQTIRAESLARGISRETPKIVLGDITRQTFVVTKQKEKMKKKKEKKSDKEDGAGSSTSRQMSPNSRELRLGFQIKHRFSYVHQSQDISAKLERVENSDLAMMHRFCSKVSTGHGRKDYTAGSLNLPILDAPFISTGASAGQGPLLDSPPLSVILVQALGTQIEDNSTPKKPFACRSTDVIEPLQVPADDPVGLSSIPLSSPVDGTIRRHLRHDPRPKRSYRGALRTLSLPDVSLRGILLGEGDVQYLSPLVTTVEAESIMAACLENTMSLSNFL